jgi:hypothetical protein
MRRAVWALLLAGGCAVPVPGGGQGDAIPVEYAGLTRVEACKKVLEELRRACLREDLSGFLSHVSRNFRRGWSELREALRKEFELTTPRRFDVWVDRETEAGGEVELAVRFEKLLDTFSSDEPQLAFRGTSRLQFREEGGRFRLSDQRDDRMFGTLATEIGTLAELSVTSVTFPAPPAPPATLTVTATILNSGKADVRSVRVRLQIDGGPFLERRIAVMAGRTTTVTWTGVPNPGSGPHFAGVTVNPLRETIESDFSNNTAETGFEVP